MISTTMATCIEYRKKSNSLDDISKISPRDQSRSCSHHESASHHSHCIIDGTDPDGTANASDTSHLRVSSLTKNTKWHSDTHLALNPHQMESKLLVNKTELSVDVDQEVTIHWDIKENVSAKDWIGLYRRDQPHPGKWLDYRNRGVSGSKKGELVWNFEKISSAFTESENRVCFRYYHGNTGNLRAASESILIRNTSASPTLATGGLRKLHSIDSGADILHLAIQDVEAMHVRKGMFFNPDPYVKIRIEPGNDGTPLVLSHHYKDARTSVCENTTEPCWRNEIFHFMTLPSDVLFMKVKNRFESSRPTLVRFLGQIHVPIKEVVERARKGLTVSYPLMGRSPQDHVCGTLAFKPTLIPYDADRLLLNGSESSHGESFSDGASDRPYASNNILAVSILSSGDEESESLHTDDNVPITIRKAIPGPGGEDSAGVPSQIHTVEATLSSLNTQDTITSDPTESVLPDHSQVSQDQRAVQVGSKAEDQPSVDISDSSWRSQDHNTVPDCTSLAEDLSELRQEGSAENLASEPQPANLVPSLPQQNDNSLEPHSEQSVTSNEYQKASKQEEEPQATLSSAAPSEEVENPQQAKPADTPEQQEVASHTNTGVLDVLSQRGEEAAQCEAKSRKKEGHVSSQTDLDAITADSSKRSENCENEEVRESNVCRDKNDADKSRLPPKSEHHAKLTALTDKSSSSPGLSSMSGCLLAAPSPVNVSLVAHDIRSTSAWSLENHAGSREDIFDGVLEDPTQVDDFSTYINTSLITSRSNPTTPDPESFPKEKRPLPQPRAKTLAEQLNNLQVIESAIATDYQFHHGTKPPDLPIKLKDLPTSSHLESQKSRRTEASEELEMPTNPAPPPPIGPKTRKGVSSHHKVAEHYGSLDVIDAKPKRIKTADKPPPPPPQLKPRKSHAVAATETPQLPPRRQKTDGSVMTTSDGNISYLDQVFEPKHSSKQHQRHHRTKDRPVPTTSAANSVTASTAESEEAKVAAEVANAAASLPRAYHMKSESIEVEEALPTGWEARVDAHGRVFYIDHHNKVTTWERPTGAKSGQTSSYHSLQRVPSISNTDRRNMDNRYRNIQRMTSVDTINERSLSPPRHHAPLPPQGEPLSEPVPVDTETVSQVISRPPPVAPRSADTLSSEVVSSAIVPASTSTAAVDSRLQQEQLIRRNSPAVKFLTRTDFFSLVQYSDEAQVAYTSNSALKHMVHKIRKDPNTFHKYWHNKDLVNFLNMFVNKDEELPGNWQRKHDKTGKVFFLDHSTKTTTFIDPRLPIVQPALHQGQQMPLPRGRYRTDEPNPAPSSPNGDDLVPTAYNEKVVLFLRQPNILQVLQDKYPLLKKNESLRNKVNTIISDGTLALKKYRNHVELTILLSMFENEIMSFTPAHLRTPHGDTQQQQTSPKGSPALGRRIVAPPYKRDFQEKYRTFLRKLEAKGVGQGPGKIKMRVRRDHILEDSFKKVMSYSKKDLSKNKLLISFLGEEGLDYGGPAREFFFLLSRELFNPYYGLFEYSANDTYTVQLSAMSTFVDDASEWFRFAGRMIGFCIVHQFLMDAFFTRPFYKMLLREPCVLSDLESLDAEFHQSLLWIKDNDISEAGLDLAFSVDEEVFGQVIERELKPNGVNILVTNRNKKEYIEKMVSWRIDRGVHEQKEHLLRGFYEVIEPKLVSIFDAKDLELVIAGTAEIDIIDWRNNTEYRSGYYDTHPVVDWFWEVIGSFGNEKRLRLLQFVTGTSSIPFEGFSALRGSNGPRKFTIEKWGTSESLPRAHTCFNRLDLPTYTAKETMHEKLLLAISETSTFGIE